MRQLSSSRMTRGTLAPGDALSLLLWLFVGLWFLPGLLSTAGRLVAGTLPL
jgi:hypothetical protein